MFFAISAISCDVRKSIKMVPTSIRKQLSNQHTPTWIDFGANLAPFWEGFGGQDGAKMAPNRSKNRSKNQSKKWSPFGSHLDRFLIDFGLQLGGSRGVRWGSVGRLFRLLNISWSQDVGKSPQDPPRPLQDPSKTPLGTNFWRFGAPTWRFLEPT